MYEPVVPDGFAHHHADVNGTRLHYVSGGDGLPLVLLPGWPRTWWSYHQMMPALARRHRVIVVDLRGMGESAKPGSGYDKKTMANDVNELVRSLGYRRVDIAGEDIGSMVAVSFAANHPQATRRLAFWEPGHPTEAFLRHPVVPQEGGLNPWWFAFNNIRDDLPEKLLAGRFRLVVDWLIDMQACKPDAIDERSREIYAQAYEQPGAVRAANQWYQTFRQDVADLAGYAMIELPTLVLGGDFLPVVERMVRKYVSDPRFVTIPGGGHYLSEERPEELTEHLLAFLA